MAEAAIDRKTTSLIFGPVLKTLAKYGIVIPTWIKLIFECWKWIADLFGMKDAAEKVIHFFGMMFEKTGPVATLVAQVFLWLGGLSTFVAGLLGAKSTYFFAAAFLLIIFGWVLHTSADRTNKIRLAILTQKAGPAAVAGIGAPAIAGAGLGLLLGGPLGGLLGGLLAGTIIGTTGQAVETAEAKTDVENAAIPFSVYLSALPRALTVFAVTSAIGVVALFFAQFLLGLARG